MYTSFFKFEFLIKLNNFIDFIIENLFSIGYENITDFSSFYSWQSPKCLNLQCKVESQK
jgi:hypothetical protein